MLLSEKARKFKIEALEIIEKDYANKLIKLSKMVSDNKLNSTNAKIVAKELHANYLKVKARI